MEDLFRQICGGKTGLALFRSGVKLGFDCTCSFSSIFKFLDNYSQIFILGALHSTMTP